MNRRAAAIETLQARLGHSFADRALLDRALTHASASQGARKLPDNERLEFLGDRVLGLIMAHALLLREADAGAGDLSKRFAGLVSGEACARVARMLGLGDALRLQGGETRRGGRDQETILADGCEALIAALYLELGLEAASGIVLRLWAPLMDEAVDPAAANPKSALQEWAAAQGKAAPVYRILERSGPDHQPRFTLEVIVGDLPPAVGHGGSLQAAQKAAALELLTRQRQPGRARPENETSGAHTSGPHTSGAQPFSGGRIPGVEPPGAEARRGEARA
jgi:ribonuclease-3